MGSLPAALVPSLLQKLTAPSAFGAGAFKSRYALANRCLAIKSVARHRYVRTDGGGYRADRRRRQAAEAFFVWRGVRPPTGAVLAELRVRVDSR